MAITEAVNQLHQNHVSFTFGRCNPPHFGHRALFQTVQAAAKGGNWFVFVSSTHDMKKNPLTHDQKVKWLLALYPGLQGHIVTDGSIKTPLQAATYLYNKGYRSATFVAGEDDMENYKSMMESGNLHGQKNPELLKSGKAFLFQPLTFSESPRLTSATNAREAAKSDNPMEFEAATGVPMSTKVDGLSLYQTVRLGMGLGNNMQESSYSDALDRFTPSVLELAKKYNKTTDEIRALEAEGAKVELEHTSDMKAAKEIARDHLNEKLNYYKLLKKVEKTDEADPYGGTSYKGSMVDRAVAINPDDVNTPDFGEEILDEVKKKDILAFANDPRVDDFMVGWELEMAWPEEDDAGENFTTNPRLPNYDVFGNIISFFTNENAQVQNTREDVERAVQEMMEDYSEKSYEKYEEDYKGGTDWTEQMRYTLDKQGIDSEDVDGIINDPTSDEYQEADYEVRDEYVSNEEYSIEEYYADRRMKTYRDFYNQYANYINWPYSGVSLEDLADRFADKFGVTTKALEAYHDEDKEPGIWYFEDDPSIQAPTGWTRVELTSPYPGIPYRQAVDMLEKTLDWARSSGAKTGKNLNTGFHISVSNPQLMDHLDYVKLILLGGDNRVLDDFDRRIVAPGEMNYAVSSLEKIYKTASSDRISRDQILDAFRKGIQTPAFAAASSTLLHVGDKYSSVNIKGKYIEFRSAGGDIMDRFDDLKLAMLQFMRSFIIAADPNAMVEEYHAKLGKLMARTIKQTGNEGFDLFQQYAAGRIDQRELKRKLKANAIKAGKIDFPTQDLNPEEKRGTLFLMKSKKTGKVWAKMHYEDSYMALKMFRQFAATYSLGDYQDEWTIEKVPEKSIEPEKPTDINAVSYDIKDRNTNRLLHRFYSSTPREAVEYATKWAQYHGHFNFDITRTPENVSEDDELPPPENARKTQIAGTLPTYTKGKEFLDKHSPTGPTLDFGAGLGIGAASIGADTYEPFPNAKFKPTFSKADSIPSNSYAKITNFNVLNVVPKNIRDDIVANIGRILMPGGTAIITTRGRDVMTAKGREGPEPMSIITSIGTYQKGFTRPELVGYVKDILGDGFTVTPVKLGPAGVLVKKNDAVAENPLLGESKKKPKKPKTIIDGAITTLIAKGRSEDEAIADLKKEIDSKFYDLNENANLVPAKQILQYVKQIHPEGEFNIDYVITDHPFWIEADVPVSSLHIFDPEQGEIHDPYNRVQDTNLQHVNRLIPNITAIVQKKPLVIDDKGYILDGNHRALAAKKAGLKTVPVWQPVKGQQSLENINEADTAVYKGRRFWAGVFDAHDGYIREVHPYKRAKAADFHHSFYVSSQSQDAISQGDAGFFWVDPDGSVNTDWRNGPAPKHIVDAIQSQIEPIEQEIAETLKKVKGKWALVSRHDPKKVLQYYHGSGHPSKEWVSKVERRVHSFSESIDHNRFGRVYLDMDGVLADFFGEWSRVSGVDHYKDIDNVEAKLQLIREHPTFWTNLPMLPNARRLVALTMELFGEYYICSKPLEGDPRSAPGKMAWIARNLGFAPPAGVVLTAHKSEYATDDGVPCILVDDYGMNVNGWRTAGGIGIKYDDHNFDHVANILRGMAKAFKK